MRPITSRDFCNGSNIVLSLAIILPVTYWAAQHALWERPEWLSGIAGLMIDLFIYWWHRGK
jgi:hypothetical protein